MLLKPLALVGMSSFLLTGLALAFKTTSIETDLSNRVGQELQAKGYGWAVVRVAGRNITLEGSSPNKLFSKSAVEVASGVPGVYKVDSRMTYAAQAASEAEQTTEAPQARPVLERADYKTVIQFSPGKIELRGRVPSAAVKQEIVRLSGALSKKARVIDDLRLDSQSPNNWRTVFGLGFSQLTRLERGSMVLTNNNLVIEGFSWSAGAARNMTSLISKGLPDPYLAELKIEPVPTGTFIDRNMCQNLVNSLKNEHRIYFDTDSARIKRLSYPLLDKLTYTLGRCPEFKVKIEGHTDDRGTGTKNWQLSKNRAESVKFYLVQAGLPEGRIYTRGYGESRPLASNREEAGRALNRRIELIVTKQKFVKKRESRQ